MPRETDFRAELAATRAGRKERKKTLRTHHCGWGILNQGVLLKYACASGCSIKNLRLLSAPPASDGWRLHIMLMEGDNVVQQTDKAIKFDSPIIEDIPILPHQVLTLIAHTKVEEFLSDVPFTIDYYVDIK